MGRYTFTHAQTANKFEDAVAFENVGHALWRIIYADGSKSSFGVIALHWELTAIGLVER